MTTQAGRRGHHPDEYQRIKRNLAKWICNLDTLEARRAFMLRLEKRQGEKFASEIRELGRQIWNGRKANEKHDR